MRLRDMQAEAHENAARKGFHDMESEILVKLNQGERLTEDEIDAIGVAFECQRIALIVSELGEAVEALRAEDYVNYHEEIADVVIRIGDHCGAVGIDLEDEIKKKLGKNSTRPRLHNKKF